MRLRLAATGLRVIAPTWPLGAHRRAMREGADLSPRGLARLVLSFLAELDLDDVVLVGNDTGGAVCQFLVDEDATRIDRLVLTDCDAFDTFPPAPFGVLFWAARHPVLLRGALQTMRSGRLRGGPAGFGGLVRRRLSPVETRPWIASYLADAAVRRDVATFARAARAADLLDVSTRLTGFRRSVLLLWAPADPYFRIRLGRRLASTFPDARLVEVPDARTFVALDQPDRVAQEIVGFVS